MKNYLKQTRTHSLRKVHNKDSKRFHWNIITICNHKCDYCYSRAAEHQWNKITNGKIIDDVINKLKYVNGSKEIFLLGGEPTMHPKYFEILEKLYNIKDVEVLGNITNGAYKDYKSTVDKHLMFKDKFYWNITYHPLEANDNNFKETILYIKKQGFTLNVNLLLDIRSKEKIEKMLEFCTTNNIAIYPSFLFENDEFIPFDDIDWLNSINEKYNPPKELHYFTENEEHVYNDIDTYLKNLNSFTGWNCINNSFVIPVNESRFSQFCTSVNFSVEDINKGNAEVICKLNTCCCPSRLGDEKFRIIT